MSGLTITLRANPPSAATQRGLPYDIEDAGITRILCDQHGKITLEPCSLRQSPPDSEDCLALITTYGPCISFEAKLDGFTITAPGAESHPKYHPLLLPVSTKQHRQSIILRPDDSIRFSNGTLEFCLIVNVEDEIKIGSSIPPPDEAMEDEVPESPGLSRSALNPSTRRTRRPTTERAAVQVEQSMQGSNTLRSTTPSRTTQQSLVVEETPATNRRMIPFSMEYSDPNAGPLESIDPKELMSTDVTTPTAIRDSFAERPKAASSPRPAQTVPSLELGSSALSDVNIEDEELTALDNEDEDDQRTEIPDFSTAPEPKMPQTLEKGSTPNATSVASEHSAAPSQVVNKMERATSSIAGGDGNTNEVAAMEETLKVDSKRQLRQGPQPEVRIPPPRSKKRTLPTEASPARRTKKGRNAQATAPEPSQDSLASSIRVRVDRTPASKITTSSMDKPEATQERNTPVASQSSHRSINSSITVQSPYRGSDPCIAFSNTKRYGTLETAKFLRKYGARAVEQVTKQGCDIVCIGLVNGTYVKSAKLLTGLALGKPIVSDDWVLESRKADKLLDTSDYPPLSAPDDWLWGNDVRSVSEVLSVDRSTLFKGKVLFFTPAVKREYGNGYPDLVKIVKATGGKAVSKTAREYKHTEDTIIVASECSGDLDGMALMGTDKDGSGYQCYNKELVSMSIIRGVLELASEEFKIKPIVAESKKGKGAVGRKRRSG